MVGSTKRYLKLINQLNNDHINNENQLRRVLEKSIAGNECFHLFVLFWFGYRIIYFSKDFAHTLQGSYVHKRLPLFLAPRSPSQKIVCQNFVKPLDFFVKK